MPETSVRCEACRKLLATGGTIHFCRAARAGSSASASAFSWIMLTKKMRPTHSIAPATWRNRSRNDRSPSGSTPAKAIHSTSTRPAMASPARSDLPGPR